MDNKEETLGQRLEKMRKKREEVEKLTLVEEVPQEVVEEEIPQEVTPEEKAEKPKKKLKKPDFKKINKDNIKKIVHKAIKFIKKAGKKAIRFTKRTGKKVYNFLKNLSKKQKIAIAVVSTLILIGIIISVINYAQTAYLKPYEEKYKIEFPKGIPEEFCDTYGRNQTFTGKLSILDKKINVFTIDRLTSPHFDKGSLVDEEQMLKSISLSKTDADIEKAFAKAENYVKNNQKIKFTSIYGEETTYQVVNAYYVNLNPDDDKGYAFPYYAYGNLTEESFVDYKDKISSRSLYFTGYDYEYDDSYLTISCDTDFMKDCRFVIVCVKIKEKDFEQIKITSENKRIHYPQKWYDDNKQKNPYWLAKKWYPVIYTDEKQEHSKVVKE